MFKSLGSFINKRSVLVLVVAVAFVAAAAWYGFGVFGKLDKGDIADRNSESTQVVNQVSQQFSDGVAQVIVLFHTRGQQSVDSPAFRQEVQNVLGHVKSEAGVKSITDYYSSGSSALVSADRKSTYALLVLPGTDSQQADKVAQIRASLHSETVDVAVGGQAAVNADVNAQIHEDLAKAEVVSFAALAILLVIVFRSVIAALLPLLLGGFAIVGAFLVTRILTEFVPISQYAINIITLLGLGLAIDYSLFMVSRFREELHRLRNVEAAITRTMETSGHTIFFSGLTIIASLLCMQIFPVDFLRSMSLGGSAAVLVAMLAALFVLPAILRLLGVRIDAWSFGAAKRSAVAFRDGSTIEERKSIWYTCGKWFMSHRWSAVLVTVGILLAAGVPFLHAHFASPDYRSLPEGSESRYVSEKLASDFGDPAAPIRIVYTAPDDLKQPAQVEKLFDYVQKVRKLDGVTSTTSIVDIPNVTAKEQYRAMYSYPLNPRVAEVYNARVHNTTTLIDVNYSGAADADQTQRLVEKLRALQKPDGTDVKVGGGPAILHDLLVTLGAYIPAALLALAVTLFVLLFMLSRSVVIPLQAIALSTLSLGAAFGALVWVFQDGHWAQVLHVTPTGSLDATMPVLIFAVAFGLSVDYSVFLYNRIREEYDANGGDNAAAVLVGLQKTGSIITSAAVLLFIVVAAFAAGKIPIMQQVGMGLALTVLIDAFVIRMILVPALMRILNHSNWWAPRFLRRK